MPEVTKQPMRDHRGVGPQPDAEHALLISGVSKSFGGVHAIQSVDLAVPAGCRFALIGPNGAGKSTLFNVVAGELKPDRGSIEVLGVVVTHMSVQKRARLGLARTYQISELFLNLSVEENLFLAAAANRGATFDLFRPWRSYRQERDWVHSVASEVGLTEHLTQRVADLSHGLRRQLEIGLAIALRPRIIMLDEPAAGLSPAERVTLAALIRSLPREVTLVFVEHDMDLVLDLADRVAVLHQGKLIAQDTAEKIRSNPGVQEVYLGRPGA